MVGTVTTNQICLLQLVTLTSDFFEGTDAMNNPYFKQLLLGGAALIAIGIGCFAVLDGSPSDTPVANHVIQASNEQALSIGGGASPVSQAVFNDTGGFRQDGEVIRDSNIRLCQGHGCLKCRGRAGGCPTCNAPVVSTCPTCDSGGGGCSCGGSHVAVASYEGSGGGVGFAGGFPSTNQPYKSNAVKNFAGVNEYTRGSGLGEPGWRDAQMIPWEAFAYGEYIGPHRQPHVAEYRLRVDDQLEFVYILTREKSPEAYRFYVGDTISISSAIDSSINVPTIAIQNDGAISLTLIGQVRVAGKTIDDLQRELNERYSKYFQNPSIVVQVIQGDTPLQDLLNSVDARAGTGGQSRTATVAPDGTVQLPLIGNVPAIGLALDEIEREINARYRMRLAGISVTPVLTQRAPRFIYVVGQVDTPGQFELTGPTTALQAIALAGGELVGGNLRQIVVFRRDQNWRLTATKLDLAGALFGERPHLSDEIWLRDSDIVLIPRSPILRFSNQVNLYLTSTLYAIFPQQGVAFDFDDFTTF